jgi:hypothetical protein
MDLRLFDSRHDVEKIALQLQKKMCFSNSATSSRRQIHTILLPDDRDSHAQHVYAHLGLFFQRSIALSSIKRRKVSTTTLKPQAETLKSGEKYVMNKKPAG